jgi:uncharacterized protein (TIGR02246 family)
MSNPGRTIVSDADKAAVAGLTQRMVRAWSSHDADAFADLFAVDGTMILPGVFRNGREEIRTFMAAAFQAEYKGSHLIGQPLDLRFLTPDVAVLLTEGGVLVPGDIEVSTEGAVRASWLLVKQQGEWQLAGYQNSPWN